MADRVTQADKRSGGESDMVATVPLELLGTSPAIALVHDLVRRSGRSRTGILFVAEEGVEIEPVARSLHAGDRGPLAPYVVVECARPAADRIEQRLFGEAKDAASLDLEAVSPESLLASARGGTLFLQDVAELPAGVQARLARLARDREALIDGEPQSMDIRLLASAHASVDHDLRTNSFRHDLYRRLAVSRIDWPSLRTRRQDIPAIVAAVLERGSEPAGAAAVSESAISLLAALPWPGNLSELRAVLDAVLSPPRQDPIEIVDLLPALKLEIAPAAFVPSGNLREARLRFEREYISAVLRHHNWRMAAAAETLGIQRPNLYRKARQLRIAVTGTTES